MNRITTKDLEERLQLVSAALNKPFRLDYSNGLVAICEPCGPTKTGRRQVTPWHTKRELYTYLAGMVDTILILKNK